MGTLASNIYDLFMQTISDYRLDLLFQISEEDFESFLESWLKFSIVDFTVCNQSLAYEESHISQGEEEDDPEVYVPGEFTETLTLQNQVILVKLMMKHWLQKNVNDITQMNLHVTDRDFKVASEAMNLREKQTYLSSIKEECSILLNDYAYHNNDWSSWFSQNFAGV